AGVCGCEEGYTEVMTSDGVLDQCTVIPVLEIPTASDNKADVKTIRAFNPIQPAASAPGRAGRTWFLQPFGPGKILWRFASLQLQSRPQAHFRSSI
ncbi:Thrombospondin type-1 domain-containing protein 7A, partial [Xenoophorus captivus]